jgi:membrane-associated phospholipid phosphatase
MFTNVPSNPPEMFEHARDYSAHAAEPISPAQRWARRLSHGLNPLLVVLPGYLLLALHTASSIGQALLWWGIIMVGVTLVPLAIVSLGVRSGRYTDALLSRREQRLIPIFIGVMSTVGSVVVLIAVHASRVMLAAVVSLLVSGILTLAITLFWKISLHIMAMAGMIAVLVMIFGPVAFVLLPLLALVAWARLWLQAHTPAQLLAGTALAMVVTLLTFSIAGIR